MDIFADDTTISSSALWSDSQSLGDNLCRSTLNLEHWSEKNHLQLNTDKTKSMLVTGKRLKSKLSPDEQVLNITTSKGVLLEQVPCYKALGVIFDQNLSFNDHIDALCKKLTKRIGLLNSIRHNLPIRERIQFYPRANGRKPGARVTNSALAFTYIRIMRCYIAQWHSGIKSRPIRHFLCHGRWYVI